MADETKSVLLDLNINLGKANQDLGQVEKNILDIKDAQSEVNKAYKAGTITQEEYVKTNVKLTQALGKETQSRNVLNKLIAAENGSLDQQRALLSKLVSERNKVDQSTKEGIKNFNALNEKIKDLNETIKKSEEAGGDFRRSVGNYAKGFKDATGNVEIHGISINKVTDSISKFGIAGGAAIGVLGALTAAYAGSSAGAKDLDSATLQLSTGLSIATNSFGEFIQRITGGEGDPNNGPLAKAAFTLNRIFFGIGAANQAQAVAVGQAQLKQLEIAKAFAQGYAKDAERIAENFRRIRDDDEQGLETQLAATERITSELEKIVALRKAPLLAELELIPRITIDYKNNRDAQLQVAQITSEIKDLEEEVNGKLTENLTARRALIKAAREESEARAFVTKRTGRSGDTEGINGGLNATQDLGTLDILAKDAEDRININTRLNRDLTRQNDLFRRQQIQDEIQNARLKRQIRRDELADISGIASQAAGIFEEQSLAFRFLASSEAAINTYRGADLALGTIPPPLGYVAAAVTIAAGLANVAKINGIGFAAGGYTGAGAGAADSSGFKPAGIVHEHEYVVPKWQVQSPAFRPMINQLESSRLRGYADGGLVTNAITANADAALVQRNMIKSLPPQQVSVKEIVRVSNRVKVKENISRLRS